MGINGYHKWLRKRFPGAFVVVRGNAPRYFDHIYVDVNALIHTAARLTDDEGRLFVLIFRKLDNLFRACIPTKSICLALDGPSSCAKWRTQRKRRLQATLKAQRVVEPPAMPIALPVDNANLLSPSEMALRVQRPPKKKRVLNSFNTLQITPGTSFMQRLKNSLCYYVCQRLATRKFSNIEWEVSGADVAGEGELKIIESIHANLHRRDRNDSYLIVSSDADLILMSLVCSIRNLSVVTSDLHSEYVIFSVWELCRLFEHTNRGQSECLRVDLAFVSLLLGNDYLPKLRGASADKLWMRYLKLKRQPRFSEAFLVNDGYAINWPFFLELISVCHSDFSAAGRLPALSMPAVATPTLPTAFPSLEAAVPVATFIETGDEDNDDDEVIIINGHQADVAMVTPPSTPEIALAASHTVVLGEDEPLEPIVAVDIAAAVDEIDTDNVDEEEEEEEEEGREADNDSDDDMLTSAAMVPDVEGYLSGLLWCLKMYRDGRCPDATWHYTSTRAPTAAAIAARDMSRAVTVPVSEKLPPLPLVFAMLVLPKEGKPYIPVALQPFMESGSPLWDLYGSSRPVTFADAMRVEELVRRIPLEKLTNEERALLRFADSLTFTKYYPPRGAVRIESAMRTPPPMAYVPTTPGPRFKPLDDSVLRFIQCRGIDWTRIRQSDTSTSQIRWPKPNAARQALRVSDGLQGSYFTWVETPAMRRAKEIGQLQADGMLPHGGDVQRNRFENGRGRGGSRGRGRGRGDAEQTQGGLAGRARGNGHTVTSEPPSPTAIPKPSEMLRNVDKRRGRGRSRGRGTDRGKGTNDANGGIGIDNRGERMEKKETQGPLPIGPMCTSSTTQSTQPQQIPQTTAAPTSGYPPSATNVNEVARAHLLALLGHTHTVQPIAPHPRTNIYPSEYIHYPPVPGFSQTSPLAPRDSSIWSKGCIQVNLNSGI